MAHDAVAGVLPLLQEDRENWRQAPRRTPRSSCSRWISCEEEYGAVISLGAGAVSFTHIVVTSEPVVSAIMMGLFLKTYDSPQTYLSLLPIVGGVALVSRSLKAVCRTRPSPPATRRATSRPSRCSRASRTTSTTRSRSSRSARSTWCDAPGRQHDQARRHHHRVGERVQHAHLQPRHHRLVHPHPRRALRNALLAAASSSSGSPTCSSSRSSLSFPFSSSSPSWNTQPSCLSARPRAGKPWRVAGDARTCARASRPLS